MISFQLTEEQEVVREAMHDFAEQAIRPAARDADEESKLPEALLAQIHELGLIATQLPAEHGGGGEERSPVTMAILLEELAWGDAALAAAALAPAAFAFAIADAGTEDQRRELLPLFCGESFHAAALALVEPGALFDPAKLATRAEARDDGFVLSGAKSLVPLGDRASHFLVVAASGDGRDAFVVPRDAAGLTISEPEKNLGLKALPTTTLRFQALELPAAARLGGSTGCDVQRLVDGARVALATTMTGVSRAALEFCVPYAKDRRAFDQLDQRLHRARVAVSEQTRCRLLPATLTCDHVRSDRPRASCKAQERRLRIEHRRDFSHRVDHGCQHRRIIVGKRVDHRCAIHDGCEPRPLPRHEP